MKDIETNLFKEQHLKDVLTKEKSVYHDKLNKVKAENQVMGRAIQKDRF